MRLYSLAALVVVVMGPVPAMGFEPEGLNCSQSNQDYVKFLYKSNIDGINEAVRIYIANHPNYDIRSLVDYMYTPFLNGASDSAKCLKDLGISPSSVAQLSNDSLRVFSYDHDRLAKMAPFFVRDVPIPEFQVPFIILVSCLALLVIYRRYAMSGKLDESND
ncbi:MAG: hypothetical protein KGI33_01855 [Thaumarchaeota archaeon]|nr:hypothetical protein [Nitrososphaerota archaeon]